MPFLRRGYRGEQDRAQRRSWPYALALAVVLAVFVGLCSAAWPHDFWINHGGYKSPADGTHCCGQDGADPDCTLLPAATVKAGNTGWLIIPLQEIVPYPEAQTSEDGEFWRCRRWDGSRRCFFAPQPSS